MTNEEIKKEILHRVAVQKKKRQRILRVSASLGAVVLVSLAGVGLMGSGVFDQTPPVTDTVVQTTTAVSTASTERENNTTAAATETTAVTTVTTTAPTQTETTYPQTQASNKGPHYRPTTRPTQTTATVKDKLVITADEPEDFSSYNPEGVLEEQGPISPALKEKMEQYKGADVVYSVIVELLFSSEELEVYKQLPYAHDELIQLREERTIAFYAYIEAKEQAGGWYTQEVIEKREVFKELDSQYTTLLDNLRNEYSVQWRNQRLKELSDWSKEALIPLTTDTKYEAFHSCDRNYAFFMKLTAEEINDLAERDGYFIRLVFPGGDKIKVQPQ